MVFFSFQLTGDNKLDAKRAVTVVETVLSQFTQRKTVLSDYYEHWHLIVSTGKEFKTQWHQFIQDARKVGHCDI